MIDSDRLLGLKPAEVPYAYSERDTMMHGLGVGLGMDPMDQRQLPFVYDGAGLRTFPTMCACLGWIDMLRDPATHDTQAGVDASQTVVAEVAIQQHAPLPAAGNGKARNFVAEVVDKGPGKPAFLRTRREVFAENGALMATMDTWLFVRGGGGFGGTSSGGPERVEMPVRAPDDTCSLGTSPNMALLYRLSLGDRNALHADPDFAKRVGFGRPILHGIASFSVAVHAVLRTFLDYDPLRYGRGKARFVAPVFPGDTIATEMWRVPDAVLFRSKAVERNVLVMDEGRLAIASG